ncbi:MAG TPA: hypothetical protein VK538_00525 [Solirubrobacteraceae bacterium]|nr:hypothetical protein [Solirubrobacteraceae bacterium]
MMKRTYPAIFAILVLALALPAVAPATLAEVGVIPPTTSPETVPSCPASPCLAVSRTTGFQLKVAKNTTLMTVPRSGSIVAWTVMLGKPNATQIKFFNANEGGAAEAGVAILRAQKPKLTWKLIASSPTVKLQPYFGKTAQFPLERTIAVKKGDVVAMTVPTWAPALALGFGKDTSWRASRARRQCASTSAQSTHTSIGSSVQYFCLYQTARLTYSATLVSTP